MIPVLVAGLLAASTPASADTAAAAQSRGIRPIWTAVGAGAGFGLGAWIGLTVFDDAIHSDRKVWTTAIVSAAVGGVLGFLVDRQQARSANPSQSPSARPSRPPLPWRKAVYGSASSAATLRIPSVADVMRR
jgi:hypothetical protein